jgi:hypothetical protein
VGIGHIIDCYVIEKGGAVGQQLFSSISPMKGLSILENSALLGLPVPEKLKAVFTGVKGGEERWLKYACDYGHGGNDPGAVYKGRKESDDNLGH